MRPTAASCSYAAWEAIERLCIAIAPLVILSLFINSYSSGVSALVSVLHLVFTISSPNPLGCLLWPGLISRH